jgi:cytochrome c biogenesis protein
MLKPVWNFFRSTRLAIVLVFLLVAIFITGILVIQAPADFSYSSPEFAYWLQNAARPRYGFWADTMAFLQLFSIFRSVWLGAVSGLLVINIMVCTVNRWHTVNNRIFKQDTNADGTLTHPTDSPNTTLTVNANMENTSGAVSDILKKRGYHLNNKEQASEIYISGVKNNYSPLGTYLSHFSLILFIIGFLVTGFFGFRDESFMVIEGQQRQVGHSTHLSLYLEDFNDEYWPDGTPKDYRSSVILFDSGAEVKQADIRVNHPLVYQGIRFHQAFFGDAASIIVETGDNQPVYQAEVALSGMVNTDNYQRPQGYFIMKPQGYLIYLTAPSTTSDDPFLSPDTLGIEIYDINNGSLITWDKLSRGKTVELLNLNFTYTDSKMFSGFMVSRDPGATIIWTAAALFLAGICAVFYFPRRELRLFIKQQSDTSRESMVLMYYTGKGMTEEIEDIAAEINGRLKNNGMDE